MGMIIFPLAIIKIMVRILSIIPGGYFRGNFRGDILWHDFLSIIPGGNFTRGGGGKLNVVVKV